MLLTNAVHSSSNIELCDVIRRSFLQPDCLPNTRAGAVKDVAWIPGLFPNRNDIHVCRVVDEDGARFGGVIS